MPPRRRRRPAALPARIDADPDRLERGFAQLLLVVADLLRELMERQAIRRMQAGSLTASQVEKLSAAFEALDERLERLAVEFATGPPGPGPLSRLGERRVDQNGVRAVVGLGEHSAEHRP